MTPSHDPADRLLARWSRHADVDALSELFDVAAPRLLRVALHLERDPAAAEDLVQQTFLVVIEKRESIDPERSAMAWMAGVLRNSAFDRMRRAGRRGPTPEVDLDALTAELETAEQRLERREMSVEVTRAIDRLREPYREVVLMRARHGASIAEIAHLLDRSPGTVRVQLHRGIEELRRLVPASLAGAGLAALLAEHASARGLEAVKAEVVRSASAAAAAATAAPVSLAALAHVARGITLMAPKSLLVGAVAVAAVVSVLLIRDDARDVGAGDVEVASSPDDVADLVDVGSPLAAPVDASEDRTTPLEPAIPEGRTFSGQVVEAATGEPIVGATVEAYEPFRGSLADALDEFPELFVVQANGVPILSTRGDWPVLTGLDATARFGRGEIELRGSVRGGDRPLASVTTDDDGRYSFVAPLEAPALVRATASGFAPRTRAVSEGDGPIALHRPHTLRGIVIGPGGGPVELELALASLAQQTGASDIVAANDVAADDARTGHVSPVLDGIGAWRTRSNADGRFVVTASVNEAWIASLDPQWHVVSPFIRAGEEVRVLVRRAPVLRFVDDETEEPIETVRLRGSERSNGYVLWSGEFRAPGGLLGLPAPELYRIRGDRGVDFQAWADGYESTVFQMDGKVPEEPVEVRLRRGAVASVRGIVHDGGAALDGVAVELIAASPLQWHRDEDVLLDATRTASDGRFSLAAAPGAAIVRVRAGDVVYVEAVVLPVDGEIDVDIGRSGGFDVLVTTPDGTPRPGHVVGLSGSGGLSEREYADDEGRVSFDAIGPGSYIVMAPFTTTEGSFGSDVMEQLELARGERREVRLVVPDPSQPRYLRVTCGDTLDFTGWRVLTERDPWTDLEPDGVVPIDLASEAWTMTVANPEGQRWSFRIPKSAPDGHVEELLVGDASYRGVLLGTDGDPIAGVAVRATSTSAGGTKHSERTTAISITDDDGRFELVGLAATEHWIQLRETPDAPSFSAETPLEETTFTTSVPAGEDVWIELEVPRVASKVRLEGRVTTADGRPFTDGMVSVLAEVETASASVRVAGGGQFQRLDADGGFATDLPRAEEFVVRVYPTAGGKALYEDRIEVPASGPITPLEISLP